MVLFLNIKLLHYDLPRGYRIYWKIRLLLIGWICETKKINLQHFSEKYMNYIISRLRARQKLTGLEHPHLQITTGS